MPIYNFETPLQLREVIYGFQASRIILTAYELDIYRHIKINGSTSEDVAKQIKTAPRATDRLMNALCAIGLLEKKNNLFFNTAFSKKFLSSDSPDFLKGFAHTLNMWKNWSGLTNVIKTGKPRRVNIKKPISKKWLEAFIGSMHERAKPNAEDIAEKIEIKKFSNILDIGGGSGAYAIAFAKKNPFLKATIFDLPHVIPLTKKYVSQANLSDRINFIEGDYLKDNFGDKYDLAFLSAIIHINSPEQNIHLIKKCYDCLLPGGSIVIQDHVMNEDRTTPYAGAFFALNMLVATEFGDTYTEHEITSWLKEAGFSEIKKIETTNNALIMGKK